MSTDLLPIVISPRLLSAKMLILPQMLILIMM